MSDTRSNATEHQALINRLEAMSNEGPMLHCMSWVEIQGTLRAAAGALSVRSETRHTIAEHLKPSKELVELADKLSGMIPSHWDSRDKRILLGFLNQHVAYHTLMGTPAKPADRYEIPKL